VIERVIDRRLAVCAVIAVALHVVLARALDALPRHASRALPPPVEVRVIAPPPPPSEPEPEPPKPPEPALEPPKPKVHERPRARPIQAPSQDSVAKDTPPVDHAPVTGDTTTTPVFGVTMESTSQAGGPAMPVGNTTRPQPTRDAAAPATAPLAAPVAAYEVTRMPIPQGRCSGKYTEAARLASVEGTVVLDLVVDEQGRARDIVVVEGLGHGLTEAAIAALAQCRFAPGEKDGKPVPVRVRGFKIRYLLQEGG